VVVVGTEFNIVAVVRKIYRRARFSIKHAPAKSRTLSEGNVRQVFHDSNPPDAAIPLSYYARIPNAHQQEQIVVLRDSHPLLQAVRVA